MEGKVDKSATPSNHYNCPKGLLCRRPKNLMCVDVCVRPSVRSLRFDKTHFRSLLSTFLIS